MNHRERSNRKLKVLQDAADRWRGNAAEVASTARRLARGGPMEATSPQRAALFVARETLKRAVRGRVGFERIVGDTTDLDDTPPTAEAKTAGRPVARIVDLLERNRVGDGFATGFVVGAELLLTNWHVFAERADAIGCGAQFGYERNDSGLLDAGVAFELDPDSFFLSDAALDIAIVGIHNTPAVGSGSLANFGRVKLIPAQGKILVGHPISIIQHPDGRHKHWGVRQNKLLLEPQDGDLFLTYSTDTLEGSSGSPAFNYDWELVAVHHSGVPRTVNGEIVTKTGAVWHQGMPDSEIDWVANEGARVSKVFAHLKQAKLADARKQAILNAILSEVTELGIEATTPPRRVEAPLPERNESVMNIVINGTANFYLGKAAIGEIAQPAPAEPQLLVGIEKKLKFDSDYENRPGFESTFLEGFDVPAPTAAANEVLKDGNKVKVLDYHHYSLVMHKQRRLVMWAAANADYDDNKRWRARKEFGSDTWKPDPRILIASQIEDLEFYEPAAKFDRGHIVRRDDVAWGETMQEEEFGNSDSFHWTNCTPQHEGFNRDAFGYKGLWGGLENHIAKQAEFVGKRLILFAGPVLDPDDPERDFGSGIEVQVPIVFWKVIVAVETVNQNPKLRAYGFLLDQTDAIDEYGWEGRFKAGKFKEHQVRLSEISQRSRVEFDQLLHNADPLALVPTESRRRQITSLDDIKLR